jgi:hypothetical protein
MVKNIVVHTAFIRAKLEHHTIGTTAIAVFESIFEVAIRNVDI